MIDLKVDELQNEAIDTFNNDKNEFIQAFAYGISWTINWFIDNGYVKEELE